MAKIVKRPSRDLKEIEPRKAKELSELDKKKVPTDIEKKKSDETNGLFRFNKKANIQSSQLYIQAAGSTGGDSSVGNHLRWFFRNELGDSHLPKGNYSKSTEGFNKENDYVRIYKTPYNRETRIISSLDLSQKPVSQSNRLYTWWYQTKKGKGSTRKYIVKFMNRLKYDTAILEFYPLEKQSEFLKAYSLSGGIIEVNLTTGLCFSIQLDKREDYESNGVKIETWSVAEDTSKDYFISNRKELSQRRSIVYGENMKKFQVQFGNHQITNIFLEYYDDFFRNKRLIEYANHVGDFALTLEDVEAYNRLENTDKFTIDGVWNNYNDGSKVNVQSCKDRWLGWMEGTSYREGIKYGVNKYITLSDDSSNLAAQDLIWDDDPNNEDDNGDKLSKTVVSYLNLLNIISSNYHVARMLGLGHIDSDQGNPNDKFIYIMEYYIQPKDGRRSIVQHLYMTLPTCRMDQRQPMSVQTMSVKYGLDNPNSKACDADGYTPDGLNRFVRVFNKLLVDYSESNSFFNPLTQFSLADMTNTIFVGIEYKEKNESSWRDPELSHQIINGVKESMPLMFFEKGESPSMIHKEIDEGEHKYATYPINIFSRVGALSNEVSTDFTKFTIPNRLLPPSNLKIQLIQEESPLLLTSQDEQNALNDLRDNNPDDLLLRVIFDFNHEHDINFQFAESIEFLFREEKQRVVKGQAKSISLNQGLDVIASDIYVINDVGLSDEVPYIDNGLEDNFKGSQFTLNGDQFIVDNIQIGSDNFPTVEVLPNQVTELVIDEEGNMTQVESTSHPTNVPERLFMLEENMENPENWKDNYFAFKLDIQFPNANVEPESFYDQHGNVIERKLRGFWDTVIFQDQGNGIYEVQFDNLQLPSHPQSNLIAGSTLKEVEFFGGYVRFHEGNDVNKERRALKVIDIDRSNSTLILIAKDESYYPTDGGLDVPINTISRVNYYPGYKVYLTTDSQANFVKSTVIPSDGYEKQTIFTAASKAQDPNYSNPIDIYRSKTAGIRTISAEKIVSPQKPQDPLGPMYATLPDSYSKAKYTFTVKSINPYALVFYRTNINAVLKALYSDDIASRIKADLLHPYDDLDFSTRWYDLVNFSNITAFSTTGQIDGTKFPFPNRSTEFNTTPEGLENIRKAIENSSFPILSKPLLFESIDQNNMSPSHPVVKLTNNELRFTDFNLDGEKADSYFYYVKEMGSKHELGDASEMIGPVQMINNRPPNAPVIRKITSQEHNDLLAKEPIVNIEILGFQEIDRVRKIRLYRSTDELDALSVRTMNIVKEIDIDNTISTSDRIVIQDEFSDLAEVPYADKLFYRVIVLRHIRYQKDNVGPIIDDYIPSLPTKLLSTVVVDSSNPDTPQLIIDELILSTNGEEFTSLKLSWNKTTYKGKYTLYKLNNRGNWNIVTVVESNNENELVYEINSPIRRLNEDGDMIYHRYKVTVVSTSGLQNKSELAITI